MTDLSETAMAEANPESLGQHTGNGVARKSALQALQVPNATSSVIEYHSEGRLVIIGPASQAVDVATRLLDSMPAIAIVDPDPGAKRPALDDRIVFVHADSDRIEGHLGDFHIHLRDRGAHPGTRTDTGPQLAAHRHAARPVGDALLRSGDSAAGLFCHPWR